MIDIHTHILPGLDDGAADIYDTIEMAALAYESGTTAMVATPHCNLPGLYIPVDTAFHFIEIRGNPVAFGTLVDRSAGTGRTLCRRISFHGHYPLAAGSTEFCSRFYRSVAFWTVHSYLFC